MAFVAALNAPPPPPQHTHPKAQLVPSSAEPRLALLRLFASSCHQPPVSCYARPCLTLASAPCGCGDMQSTCSPCFPQATITDGRHPSPTKWKCMADPLDMPTSALPRTWALARHLATFWHLRRRISAVGRQKSISARCGMWLWLAGNDRAGRTLHGCTTRSRPTAVPPRRL